MRQIIAALSVTLDGFIEGPNGELDWAMADDEESWKEAFELCDTVDTCLLGRVMYPGYEQYWLAVLANPRGPLPFSGQPATKSEITYARWADKVPHIVLSTTLDKVAWKTTRIARDVDEIRRLKGQAGRNVYVVGGATLVSSLMNMGLIDELRLTVHPLILGGGKPLFKDVKQRHPLQLTRMKQFGSGKVRLTYGVSIAQPHVAA